MKLAWTIILTLFTIGLTFVANASADLFPVAHVDREEPPPRALGPACGSPLRRCEVQS